MDFYGLGLTQFAPSSGTLSLQGSKRKAWMVDALDTQFDKFTTKFYAFVDVIGIGNAFT